MREKPILLVIHEAEDDCWHFLCGTNGDEMNVRVISLRELLQTNPDVAELADLPLGWKATRDTPTDNWCRSACDADQD